MKYFRPNGLRLDWDSISFERDDFKVVSLENVSYSHLSVMLGMTVLLLYPLLPMVSLMQYEGKEFCPFSLVGDNLNRYFDRR